MFEGNQLTIKSLKALFKLVQRNKNIKKINMKDNPIYIENKDKVCLEFKKKGVDLTL